MKEDVANKIIIDSILNPPDTSSGLYKFMEALTGERVVFKNVCPDCTSPWNFIWESYRIDLPSWREKTADSIIVLGPRGGHKTLSEAKLIVAELLLKPGCEILAMGAISSQASRCSSYVRKYLQNKVILDSGLIDKLLKETIVLRNSASYRQVVATSSGVKSNHSPKLRVDEAELIESDIISEARMIPASTQDWHSHIAYISTRQQIEGTMSDLLAESKQSHSKIIKWCYKESSEPCPESRRGRDEKIYEIEDIYNPGETIVVKAYVGCETCPLLRSCRGSLAKATGTVSIDDSIREFL